MIDGESFYIFTKNTWMGNCSTLCHITNNVGLHFVTNIDELVQGSAGSISFKKKSKLCMKVRQVDEGKKLHILFSVKYCASVHANLFLLTCELLQENKICRNNKNNNVIKTANGKII